MNILHHKSWHVRTKKNIDKVRKDEAKAAEEEQEKLRRIALAEQEARTSLLRNRSKARQLEYGEESIGPQLSTPGPLVEFVKPQHINLFEGEESSKLNEEHEQEKKEEKEKYEKSIGLLTYLGQSASESQASTPWYYNPADVRYRSGSKEDKDSSTSRPKEQDLKKKRSLDPMVHMSKYVELKRKKDNPDEKKEYSHKHKKHKSSETKSKSQSSVTKTIEQLRAERLKREKSERFRSEQLLAKARGDKVVEPEKQIEYDDRKRTYNSQYNPEYVRKPKDKETKYTW